jgi:hypothetical protein
MISFYLSSLTEHTKCIQSKLFSTVTSCSSIAATIRALCFCPFSCSVRNVLPIRSEVTKSVDKHFFPSQGIYITNSGGQANKKLGNCHTRVNSRNIRVHSVGSKRFIMLMDIQGWEWQFVVLLEDSTHGYPGILGGTLEGMLDNILRKPCKVGAQLSKILLIFHDLMFMSLVQPREIWDDVIIQNRISDKQIKDTEIPVVTLSIKRTAIQCIREVRNGIKPLFIINQLMIQDRGVPIAITGQNNMR